ncbi:hypothetical protein AB4Y32_05560 [Paraburkholderia phymatum]|uniref:Uncharacterized protein n=1 Tax=Paraburkholderia phymatum TaxID=148447 RepID=A0ACC6TVB3_9BURK
MKIKHKGISIAVLALVLAACGGGGSSTGSSSAATQTTTPQTPTQTNTDWTYQGSAPTVNGVNGLVAVVLVPDTLTGNSLSGTAFTASNGPLASQVQQSNYGGAFTTIASSSLAVSLTKGSTIADINGAGGYVAIGRWTHGSDSSGGNYTADQGAHYAVGTPLTLTPGIGTLSCTNLMDTAPTSATGSVAPGSLVSATATLDLATLNLTNFSATVTIGADTAATFTKASASSSGSAMGGGVALMTRLMGNDSAKPLVAVAYGAKLTNTGDINGLVVLSCQ